MTKTPGDVMEDGSLAVESIWDVRVARFEVFALEVK